MGVLGPLPALCFWGLNHHQGTQLGHGRCFGMPGLLTLLITLIVVLAIIAIAWWAINQLTLPPPVRMIAVLLIAALAIVVLLNLLPGFRALG